MVHPEHMCNLRRWFVRGAQLAVPEHQQQGVRIVRSLEMASGGRSKALGSMFSIPEQAQDERSAACQCSCAAQAALLGDAGHVRHFYLVNGWKRFIWDRSVELQLWCSAGCLKVDFEQCLLCQR
eukprot:TRINITY_DN40478_c0_g2_i1.p3 TRINITY_DN40478_c0_g2~~TRINITY_DN40478_c0_g2_i1.p3  ORF type:complete len:124 (-),score=10.54 TRINITY_DN40478_c0_g2_i1:247-618(-)